MSRRNPTRRTPVEQPPETGPPGRSPSRLSLLAQIGILIAVFAIVSLLAELAGAANLGVAFSIGEVAFAIALMAVMLRS